MNSYVTLAIWFIWLILIILWNFLYPQAIPLMDVLVAVVLSLVSIGLKKIAIKKKSKRSRLGAVGGFTHNSISVSGSKSSSNLRRLKANLHLLIRSLRLSRSYYNF